MSPISGYVTHFWICQYSGGIYTRPISSVYILKPENIGRLRRPGTYKTTLAYLTIRAVYSDKICWIASNTGFIWHVLRCKNMLCLWLKNFPQSHLNFKSLLVFFKCLFDFKWFSYIRLVLNWLLQQLQYIVYININNVIFILSTFMILCQ